MYDASTFVEYTDDQLKALQTFLITDFVSIVTHFHGHLLILSSPIKEVSPRKTSILELKL